VSKRSAERRAARAGWPYEEQTCRGGRRRLYRLEMLPTDVRRAVELYLAVQAAREAVSMSSAPIPAPGGETIQAGFALSPAHTSPAATAADGLSGAGGAGCAFAVGGGAAMPQGHQMGLTSTGVGNAGNGRLTRGAGSIPATRAYLHAIETAPTRADEVRLIEAARRKMVIAPILRGEIKGRVAIEAHARAHGTTAATLYRWVKAFRHGGDVALVDKPRADRGQARVVISDAWETFCRAALVPQGRMLEIAAEMTRVVRGLWAQSSKPSWRQVALLAEAHLINLTAEACGCEERTAKAACRLTRRFVEGERRFSVVALKDRLRQRTWRRTLHRLGAAFHALGQLRLHRLLARRRKFAHLLAHQPHDAPVGCPKRLPQAHWVLHHLDDARVPVATLAIDEQPVAARHHEVRCVAAG